MKRRAVVHCVIRLRPCAGCFPYPPAQRELIGLADRFWQEL